MKPYLYICFSFLLLASCRWDKEDELFPGNDCDTTDVSFDLDIKPILVNRCSTPGCHVQGGGSSVLFDTYAQVKAKVDDGKFNQRVVVQQDMPPGQPLSKCQMDKIKKWLEIGAPDN